MGFTAVLTLGLGDGRSLLRCGGEKVYHGVWTHREVLRECIVVLLSNWLMKHIKTNIFFSQSASGGGMENVRRMISGEFDTILAHSSNSHDAWNGVDFFEGQKPFKGLRLVAKVAVEHFCVATLAKLPIKKYMDLEGKKVATGVPGSVGVPISRDIFKALGLTDKVKQVNIGFEAASQGLRDGQLDVSMGPGGLSVPPAIVEIARSITVRLVEPAAEEINIIGKNIPYLYWE